MEGASRGIVQEVLTKDNYDRWKILMKNYLLGKDLWEVVQSGCNLTIARKRMMNAKALHIIQLSCGPKIFDQIKHFETAKDAWNFLASRYGSDLKAKPATEPDVVVHIVDFYGELLRFVEREDSKGAESFITRNKDELFLPRSSDKRTVLHEATMAGHVKVVELLVNQGKEDLLKMQDEQGYTALALAADLTGNDAVAKCLVKDCDGSIRQNLLAIANNNGDTPLLLAARKGHKDMTRFLFDQYKKEDMEQHFCKLLEPCIKGEIFDVALELLESYRNILITESLSKVVGAMNGLAKKPSAFLSGCQFELHQKIIYQIIRVEGKFQISYEGRHKTNSSGWFCRLIMNLLHLPGKVLGWFCKSIMNLLHLPEKVLLDSFCRPIVNLLHLLEKVLGWFCKFIMNLLLLHLPEKVLDWFCRPIMNLPHLLEKVLLGGLFHNALIRILTRLNIFGSREIHEKKHIHSQVQKILWHMQSIVKSLNNSELHKALVYDAMLDAAKYGTVEFIDAMTEVNHDLLRATDKHKRGIFSYAVLHRKQKVFQLIYNLNGRNDIIKYETDVFDNNLLHLAAHLGPSSDVNDRAGAALQMQREFQWFKAVEEVVSPMCKETRNDDGKKPRELFVEMHKELVKEGEKWTKQAAKSFALVGILITTIMFAAAFTVPGGNHQESGVPIFLKNSLLTAFLIADAISLFTSSTSVLIFIWILTSRFSEKDFLKILPYKLLFGLFFLFLSVVSMIIAFCAALGIVLKDYPAYMRLVVPGVIFGIIPVIVLIPSQVTLIWKILRSTLSNPISLRTR